MKVQRIFTMLGLSCSLAWFSLGCKSEGEQKPARGTAAQSPAVDGMRWLKEHGYVDQNGRPIKKGPNKRDD